MQRQTVEGVIGPLVVVRGRVAGKGDLRVEGVVEGEIETEGAVVVGPDATVVGPLRARSVEVDGEVHGRVHADEGVTLRAGGLVHGDVRARRIAIDDGASLHGGIEMDFEVDGEGACAAR